MRSERQSHLSRSDCSFEFLLFVCVLCSNNRTCSFCITDLHTVYVLQSCCQSDSWFCAGLELLCKLCALCQSSKSFPRSCMVMYNSSSFLSLMLNGWRSLLHHNNSSFLLSIMRTGWRSALHNKSSSLLSIMHNGRRSASHPQKLSGHNFYPQGTPQLCSQAYQSLRFL